MSPFAYHAVFSQQDYETLRRGLIPEEMEDKWFVFWEADTLFFHRSWTGLCVYRVEFAAAGEQFQVSGAAVSNDSQAYRRGSDAYEAALVDFLIRGLLLHERVEFPVAPGTAVPGSPGLYQHHIAGTGVPERILPRAESQLVSWIKRLFA